MNGFANLLADGDHANAISARSSQRSKWPIWGAALMLAGLAIGPGAAGDDAAGPAFVLDRAATLRWLEGSKAHKPRLPLPQPSDEDIQRGKASPLGIVNNGLMRRHYLPSAWSSFSSSGLAARQGKVDSTFKVELFWIASRLNQCAYCLGHQEVKLASAGLTEDAIAALDGDWTDADPTARAARLLAVHKTMAPQKPVPKDVLAALASRFDEAQIEEIILAVANYNAMNRWTGPLNIPQEDHRTYAGRANEKTAGNVSKLIGQAREIAGTKRDLPAYEAWLAAVRNVAEAGPNPTEAFLSRQGEFGEGRLKSWRQALTETTPEDAVPARLRARIFWLCARLDNGRPR